MKILGIETSTIVCGVSIVGYNDTGETLRPGKKNFTVLAGARSEQERVHSEKLAPFVEQTAEKAGIRLSELDGIAVSIGPGSFTGLRIGISMAKGLAFGLGKPILAIPTLPALAYQASFLGHPVLAALDARRNEIFWELFPIDYDYSKPESRYQLSPMKEALAGKLKKCMVVGDIDLTPALEAHWLSRTQIPADEYRLPDASSVAILGGAMLARGRVADVSTLDADYGRSFKGAT